MKHCHSCGLGFTPLTRVGRRDACEGCGADLHCCLNCRHHDPFAPNECKEPNTEVVRDRSAGNYCEAFDFREGDFRGGPAGKVADPAAEARAKLDALFKKS